LTTIVGTSFVGPAAARLALMMVACVGLVLVTPTPAPHHVDASIGLDGIGCQTPADSARDGEWRHDVNGGMSDACDDDDDGDDESSSASGHATFDHAYLAPDFRDSEHVSAVKEDRLFPRARDLHLLRGPPALPMEESTSDDSTGTHRSISGSLSDRGVNRGDPHLPLLSDQFRSASAQSDYGLRAPP